jgi:hypothetical protein
MVIGEDPKGRSAGSASCRVPTSVPTPGSGSAAAWTTSAVYGPGLDEPFDHYPVGGDAVLVRTGSGSSLYLAFIGNDRDRVVEFRLGYKPIGTEPLRRLPHATRRLAECTSRLEAAWRRARRS